MIDLTERGQFSTGAHQKMIELHYQETPIIPWDVKEPISDSRDGDEDWLHEPLVSAADREPKSHSRPMYFEYKTGSGNSNESRTNTWTWVATGDTTNIHLDINISDTRTAFTGSRNNITFTSSEHMYISNLDSDGTTSVGNGITYNIITDKSPETLDIWGASAIDRDPFSDPAFVFEMDSRDSILPFEWEVEAEQEKKEKALVFEELVPWFKRTSSVTSAWSSSWRGRRNTGGYLTNDRPNDVLAQFMSLIQNMKYSNERLFENMEYLEDPEQEAQFRWDSYIEPWEYEWMKEHPIPWDTEEDEDVWCKAIPKPDTGAIGATTNEFISHQYTKLIDWCIPWMKDMLRDTWRNVINPDLVTEYFSANWYTFDAPEYREKWFHPGDAITGEFNPVNPVLDNQINNILDSIELNHFIETIG